MIIYEDICQAHKRINDYIHRTPVFKSTRINERFGCSIWFKCENMQKVGAFKFRGALNAVSMLSVFERQRGVVTHSSGNHAQALSLAAKIFNVPAFIVMPNNAPQVKIDAVKEYGGIITFCEPVLEQRELSAQILIEKHGANFIHPYDNENIIAGQGTCAKEFLEQVDQNLDVVMTPVGGGGLLSGTAISVKANNKATLVYGAEPQMADDAYKSFYSGKIIPQTNPQTIADGLLTSLGDITFDVIKHNVDDILLCSEKSIIMAMKIIFQNLKIVVEPSAAVGLACVIDNPERFRNQKVGIILSGGNIDVSSFGWR
ncbi:MAG: pyridoxal-phosphate dependent enzyme [Bacteroidales bacterium]|nr:pyridoxal-phosphate dependent enzyme [Bacteroidales bacterium]